MSEPLQSLRIGDSRITLLGTAHVSRASAEAVRDMIRSKEFDVVCIELCQSRHNSLMHPEQLAEMDLFAVIRQGRANLVTAHLALGAYQQRMAEQLGVELGLEMKTAITEAATLGLPVVLIDREVGITLNRVYRNISFWKRAYLVAGLFAGALTRHKISEEEIEQMKAGDVLEIAFTQFSEQSRELSVPMIDERDRYMAARIHQTLGTHPGKRILAVVGAGHLKGMTNCLKDETLDAPALIEELNSVPPKKSWPKFIPWIIVILIGLGFYFGFRESPELGWKLVWQWVLINGSLSALGAAIAGAHPVTVGTAFVAAPITSLNPTIGAGMVTAAVELAVRKPTVRDFRELRKDTATFPGWRKNAVAKTLLVFVLSTLGSAIGTYVAGFRIFGQLL